MTNTTSGTVGTHRNKQTVLTMERNQSLRTTRSVTKSEKVQHSNFITREGTKDTKGRGEKGDTYSMKDPADRGRDCRQLSIGCVRKD